VLLQTEYRTDAQGCGSGASNTPERRGSTAATGQERTMAEQEAVRVLVWDENPPHAPKEIYPNSINGAVGEGLERFGGDRVRVRTADLDDPEQGVTEQALSETDVLVWWGHARHKEVSDETVARVVRRVHEEGMGFLALHSAHYSRTFQAVVEGPGHLKGGWREMDPPEQERIRVCAPWHPIAAGIEDFILDGEEYYGAPFDVPPPLEVIFQSYFPYDGRTFPSGLTWTVGPGKTEGFECGPGKGIGEGYGNARVFYFRPGHETIPTYYNETIQRVITNGVLWCGCATG
jgi:trehalose utilization protein